MQRNGQHGNKHEKQKNDIKGEIYIILKKNRENKTVGQLNN